MEAQLEQLQGAPAAVRRALGDLQLLVQRPDVQVGGRHRTDERQNDGAPSLLSADQLGAGRLGGTAELAPKVDLPTRTENRLILVVRVVTAVEATKAFFAQPLAKCVGIAGGRRELIPAGRKIPAEELLDAGRCNQQVLVLLQGLGHQTVQNGILELLPPGGVGEIPDLLLLEPPGHGGIDGRTFVVRTDRHAAGQRQQENAEQNAFRHAHRPPCWSRRRPHEHQRRWRTAPASRSTRGWRPPSART